MRICDLTHAYTATSGGIRTYIDAKRRFIQEQTDWEHVLIHPAERDSLQREGRLTTIEVKGPIIPGAAPYRLFVRGDKVHRALKQAQPDVVELSSFYTCPWIAFAYRRTAMRLGRPNLVSAYYFTDLPTAYVEPAAARLMGPRAGRWAKRGAERYVRAIMNRLDLAFTSFPAHEQSLRALDVDVPLRNVPLGVDLEQFHPRKRSGEVRARFGVTNGGLLLIYAGRLDSEKHIEVLVDALERLSPALGARLVLVGEGRHRARLAKRAERIRERLGEERLFILPYTNDKPELAELLASADVYVTAGPHETFALSVAEGQAAGLPVVGVAAGALVDRVVEGTGLLGPVGDGESMAANILRVAAQHRQMRAAARAHVEEALSWERCFTTIFEIYEREIIGTEQVPELHTAV